MKQVHMTIIAGCFLAAALFAGCASGGLVFSQKSEASVAAIRAAEEVGATKIPMAALYLQHAKEELERAKGMAGKGAEEQAVSLLTRAEIDAELAITLSREHEAKMETAQAKGRLQRLREENQLHEEASMKTTESTENNQGKSQ